MGGGGGGARLLPRNGAFPLTRVCIPQRPALCIPQCAFGVGFGDCVARAKHVGDARAKLGRDVFPTPGSTTAYTDLLRQPPAAPAPVRVDARVHVGNVPSWTFYVQAGGGPYPSVLRGREELVLIAKSPPAAAWETARLPFTQFAPDGRNYASVSLGCVLPALAAGPDCGQSCHSNSAQISWPSLLLPPPLPKHVEDAELQH